ncbi:hypothetical protein [Pyrococcus sp. ST04]|uniref:hypothetical protein n=1 Tax=Pyrococcus sp. ST04 TaxID=1183377 RepID=UPI0002605DFE|nr:hypothetical protein [Pyrococcus sp. ST04]AFK22536.1 hypothetical protein Py04_0954 [Pyrococcus sp. ST04]
MQTIIIDVKVPHDMKGEILRKLAYIIHGRIRKAKLLPPDKFGYSEIVLNLETDNPRKILSEISKLKIKTVRASSH